MHLILMKFLMELVESVLEHELVQRVFKKTPEVPPSPTPVAPTPAQIQGWSKDVSDCHEKIKAAYPSVLAQFVAAHPDCNLKVDYTYRGPALQMELYKKGRQLLNNEWVVVDATQVVTQQDGTKVKSHHNTYPAQAADIYIVQNGKILWDSPLYEELGHLWEKQGLISGATWKYQWKDKDHVQCAYDLI